MNLKPGLRLRSAVCATEVVVIQGSTADVDLRCGGHPLLLVSDPAAPEGLAVSDTSGTQLGKRYAHEDGFELLCTKAGAGGLSVGDEPLPVKAAKSLPSSD